MKPDFWAALPAEIRCAITATRTREGLPPIDRGLLAGQLAHVPGCICAQAGQPVKESPAAAMRRQLEDVRHSYLAAGAELARLASQGKGDSAEAVALRDLRDQLRTAGQDLRSKVDQLKAQEADHG